MEFKTMDDLERKESSRSPMQFEDALTLTGLGRFNYLLIVISGVALSTVLFETLSIGFIMPLAQCDLELTIRDKGLLGAVAFAGIISSSHLWGFLADTIGRKRIILPTLFISFLCTLISSFANGFWMLVIFRYLCGFFISGPSATIYAYLSEFHNTKNRGRAIMGAQFIFGLGCIALPVMAWGILSLEINIEMPFFGIVFKQWRLFMLVCGLPSLLCALALLKVPESPKYVLLEGNETQAINILRLMYVMNNKGNCDEYTVLSVYDESLTPKSVKTAINYKSPTKVLEAMWQQTAPLFQESYIKTTTLACIIQFGIFFTSNGMWMWFPEILHRIGAFREENPDATATICEILDSSAGTFNYNANSTQLAAECSYKLDSSTFFHVFTLEIGYALGFAVIGLLINALGKLTILLIIFVGCGACGIAIVYTTIPLVSINLYCVLLLCGLTISVVNSATVDSYPTNLRAMAVCISLMMGRLGSVVGANMAGVMIEYNCSYTYAVCGFMLIGCGILTCFVPNIYQSNKRISK